MFEAGVAKKCQSLNNKFQISFKNQIQIPKHLKFINWILFSGGSCSLKFNSYSSKFSQQP